MMIFIPINIVPISFSIVGSAEKSYGVEHLSSGQPSSVLPSMD